MKIKPNTNILYYDGTPIRNTETKKTVTLKEVIVSAINTVEEGDGSNEKVRAFDISLKLFSQDEVDLSVEDMNFILKKAEKNLVPVAYGRLKEIFND